MISKEEVNRTRYDEKNNVYNKWCILNYMNPLIPGGGFEKEASVYEEALSLSSGLYFSLTKGEGACMFTKNYEYEQNFYLIIFFCWI